MKATYIRRGYVVMIDAQPCRVDIEMQSVGELTVVQTSPVMGGAKKTASTKPAKLSNGVTIQVPEFISEGEKVRVDPCFFSSRRRHTRCSRDWSSDVCSSD